MQTQPTTPFGRRSLSLAMVASQASARDFAGKPGNSETVVHKWRLFRALTEAKTPLGVTDRALSVLHALLSFHQETALTLPAADPRADDEDGEGSAGIVVFPSNRELSIRAHGMAPATLRRHLACLVDAGLIIRRDSPNGKRYARRGQGGEIESAFGFDLTPLVARADEIENLAEEVRAENKADQTAARTHHAAPPRYRQDDRDRAGGGRSRRLAGAAPALCGAIEPLRAQFIACRSGGVGERTCRIKRRNPERSGKSRKSPKKERQ